jgi:hypothetical protein
LKKIEQRVKDVSILVEEISVATEEQSTGIQEINTVMSQMDRVVQQNASSSEESASSAEQLSSQAEDLARIVEELVQLSGNSGLEDDDSYSDKIVEYDSSPEDSYNYNVLKDGDDNDFPENGNWNFIDEWEASEENPDTEDQPANSNGKDSH